MNWRHIFNFYFRFMAQNFFLTLQLNQKFIANLNTDRAFENSSTNCFNNKLHNRWSK